MAAIWMRFGTELRARWRGTLALVLLLGFGPRVPLAAIVALVPAAVLVANLAAAVPGWLAVRIRPAEALRVE